MRERVLRIAVRLSLVVLVLMVVTSSAATIGIPVASAAAPVALTIFTGTAGIVRPGTALRPASTGDRLGNGDTVVTGTDSKASLLYPDGSVTRLDSQTVVTVRVVTAAAGGVKTSLAQAAGLTWNNVKQLVGGASFSINGPNSASVAVRGTEFGYYVEYDSAGNPVIWVDTWSGSVDVRGAVGPAVTASTGQRVTVRVGSAPTVPAPIPDTDRQLSFTVFNQALNAVTGRPFAVASGSLSPGGTAGPTPVAVDGRSDIQFVLAWPGSTFGLTIRDGTGSVLAQRASGAPPLSLVVHPARAGTVTFTVNDVQSTPQEAWWVVAGRG
jgi:hypothetical protein